MWAVGGDQNIHYCLEVGGGAYLNFYSEGSFFLKLLYLYF